LCNQIANYMETGRTLNVVEAYAALSGDVITKYAFGFSDDGLESAAFSGSFHDALKASVQFGHLAVQFPALLPLITSLPDWINLAVNPVLSKVLKLHHDLQRTIRHIRSSTKGKTASSNDRTIFDDILQSSLPASEKTDDRLTREAQGIVGAGLLTTSWSLSVATFHILNTPSILDKLRSELFSAIPDPNATLEWAKLEKLPYLSAVIKEAARLSYGTASRSPRIIPYKEMRYGEWSIPPGIPISMTTVDVSHDEAIFPESHLFEPERWLGAPRTKDGLPLEKYNVSFQKGQRSCLGIKYAIDFTSGKECISLTLKGSTV
jgi:cytochrome P450